MTIPSMERRLSLSSIASAQEHITGISNIPNNQSNTQRKIPSSPEVYSNNQPRLDERNIKASFSLTTVYNALQSCLEAIVSVFSYIFDKIGCFVTYILSKLLPQAQQDQAISITTSINSEYSAAIDNPFRLEDLLIDDDTTPSSIVDNLFSPRV